MISGLLGLHFYNLDMLVHMGGIVVFHVLVWTSFADLDSRILTKALICLQRLQEEVLDRRIKNGIYSSFKVDCTYSPTLMDSFNFSNLPIVEDQFLQKDLDKATENNIRLHTNMDSVEFTKSSQGEEVDDFLTVTSATERQNVPEESDKNKHSV